MRKVKCYACGKSYDYDEDGFCPNCGGFNQPRHGSAISADGSVVSTPSSTAFSADRASPPATSARKLAASSVISAR